MQFNKNVDVSKTQFVLLEDAVGIILLEDSGRVRNEDTALEITTLLTGDKWTDTVRTGPAIHIQLEDQDTGNSLLLEDGNELLTEDSTGANAFTRNQYEISNEQGANALLLNGVVDWNAECGNYQGWPIYEFYVGPGSVVRSSSMTPSKLSGSVAIGHNGTTATGSGTLFSTELSVGDVFQTSDENILLEASTAEDEQFVFEDDERIVHETDSMHYFWYIAENTINDLATIQVNHFRLFISTEEVGDDYAKVGGNVIGEWCTEFNTSVNTVPSDWNDLAPFTDARWTGSRTYDINTTDESYFVVGEDSNAGLYFQLEDASGQLIQESSDAYSEDLLLETDDKMLFTEPGEFKVASITNDTSLVVTRKHWGGTDVVPFWKRTTPVEVGVTITHADLSEPAVVTV